MLVETPASPLTRHIGAIDALPFDEPGSVIEFFVPGQPTAKGRARHRVVRTKAGREFVQTYTPLQTASYENLVRLAAQEAMAGRPPLQGAVELQLRLDMSVPASWSRKKRLTALAGYVRPTTKPDCSNVLKAIEDAMNGIVWVDDVQAVEVRISKRYAEKPGATVRVARD
jgi:Holliday junction resolvase RusA-like endonuclease